MREEYRVALADDDLVVACFFWGGGAVKSMSQILANRTVLNVGGNQ